MKKQGLGKEWGDDQVSFRHVELGQQNGDIQKVTGPGIQRREQKPEVWMKSLREWTRKEVEPRLRIG